MDVEESQTEGQEPAIDIGARLCEARDNLGLDSEKVAKELNLAVEIITKIEQNIFHQDIPVAFIRGYVKAYSTKVGLDTPKILAEFDNQTSGDAPSLSRVQSISKFDSGRRELNSNSFIIKAISAIVILLFLSYGGYELWKRFASHDSTNEIDLALNDTSTSNDIDLATISDQSNLDDPVTSEDVSQVPENQQDAGLVTELKSSIEPTLAATPSTTNTQQNAASLVSSANDSGSQSDIGNEQISTSTSNQPATETFEMTPLVFDFSADCWVRIVDARGEVLAVGVKRAGKHMPIEGVKPFNVVLGDPSVVTLQYNNQSYDLSGYRAERRAEIILN